MASLSGSVQHEQVPAAIRIAQMVGITSAGFLSGYITSFTLVAVPAVLENPSAGVAARQWLRGYQIGASTAPFLALASSLTFGYLATKVESSSLGAFKLYTAAAVVIPCIVPFTFTVMKSNIETLQSKANTLGKTEVADKAAEAGVAKEERVHALIDKWGSLNLVRAAIALTGTVCGTLAVLNHDIAGASSGVSRVGFSSGANRLG